MKQLFIPSKKTESFLKRKNLFFYKKVQKTFCTKNNMLFIVSYETTGIFYYNYKTVSGF